jgi:Mg2+/Co2+ transporter CorB
MNEETLSAKEQLENKTRFLKKLVGILLVIIILDLAFRMISIFAPDRINYITYFPGFVLILLVIPLGYRLKAIKKQLQGL